eukprot:m51a1_g5460 hypothetical protein (1206) ;mRNA; r:238583-246546
MNVSLLDLCADVVVAILVLLCPVDRARVSATCRALRACASHPLLWRCVALRSTSRAVCCLARHPRPVECLRLVRVHLSHPASDADLAALFRALSPTLRSFRCDRPAGLGTQSIAALCGVPLLEDVDIEYPTCRALRSCASHPLLWCRLALRSTSRAVCCLARHPRPVECLRLVWSSASPPASDADLAALIRALSPTLRSLHLPAGVSAAVALGPGSIAALCGVPLLEDVDLAFDDTGALAALGLMLRVWSLCIIRRRKKVAGVDTMNLGSSFFDEDDRVAFDEGCGCCCAPRTMSFLVPNNTVLVALLSALWLALMGAGAAHYCAPGRFGDVVGKSAKYPLLVLTWFTFVTSAFSLLGRTPPEPSVYGNDVPHLLNVLSRPTWVIAVFIVDLVARLASSDALNTANAVLHYVLALIPVAWAFAVAPQAHVMAEWAVEQLFHHCLGGTYCADTTRLAKGTTFSIVSIILTFVVMRWVRISAGVAVAAGLGYFLSSNTLLSNTFPRRTIRLMERSVFFGCSLIPVLSIVYVGLFSSVGLWIMYNDDVYVPIWRAALVTRALRWSWQAPHKMAWELGLAFIVIRIANGDKLNNCDLDSVVFLVSICWQRLKECLHKLHFFVVLMFTTITKKKLLYTSRGLVILLQLVFLPLNLATIALSTALSAPMHPFLGIPLFFIGFPRPQRCWSAVGGPASDTTGIDSVYYKQLIPRLLSTLQGSVGKKNAYGRITRAFGASMRANIGVVAPGDMFLFRLDDRIIFAHVIEGGRGYNVFSFKGLELRPTTCHNEEGREIDRVFEGAYGSDLEQPALLNSYLMHTMTPIAKLPIVAYSVSPSKLTGIVENSEFLREVSSMFWKTLVYNTLREMLQDPNFMSQFSDIPVVPDVFGARADERFPMQWFEFVSGQLSGVVFPVMARKTEHLKPAYISGALQRSASAEDTPGKEFNREEHLAEHDPKHKQRSENPISWFVTSCHGMVDYFGLGGLSPELMGPSHVLSSFYGDIPKSSEADWMKERPKLQEFVIKCYRQAFKITYDTTVYGEEINDENLFATLQEQDKLCFIGKVPSDEWALTVAQEKLQCVFGIAKVQSTTGENVAPANGGRADSGTGAACNGKSALPWAVIAMNLRDHDILVGTLNPEVARGLWAGMALEMLYMTNDDDERYSIQAHPTLLRNIMLQCAEPPLGYPVVQQLISLPRRQIPTVGPAKTTA